MKKTSVSIELGRCKKLAPHRKSWKTSSTAFLPSWQWGASVRWPLLQYCQVPRGDESEVLILNFEQKLQHHKELEHTFGTLPRR